MHTEDIAFSSEKNVKYPKEDRLLLYRPWIVIRRKSNVRKAFVNIEPMNSYFGSLFEHLHNEIQEKKVLWRENLYGYIQSDQ